MVICWKLRVPLNNASRRHASLRVVNASLLGYRCDRKFNESRMAGVVQNRLTCNLEVILQLAVLRRIQDFARIREVSRRYLRRESYAPV